MAWVKQTFSGDGIIASLGHERVVISTEPGVNGVWIDPDQILTLEPCSMEQAHALALIFRRVARRLEEIGKGLP